MSLSSNATEEAVLQFSIGSNRAGRTGVVGNNSVAHGDVVLDSCVVCKGELAVDQRAVVGKSRVSVAVCLVIGDEASIACDTSRLSSGTNVLSPNLDLEAVAVASLWYTESHIAGDFLAESSSRVRDGTVIVTGGLVDRTLIAVGEKESKFCVRAGNDSERGSDSESARVKFHTTSTS